MIHTPSLAVIDVETSGTNAMVHDVVSVALVPLDRELPPIEIFIAHKNIQWTDFALSNFQRFEAEWKARAIDPMAAVSELEGYVERVFDGDLLTLIGHNVGFDMSFIKRLAFQAGRESIKNISHRAIDTHSLLYLLFLKGEIPKEALTSEGAFRHFNINISDGDRHTARGDAVATALLFQRIVERLGATGPVLAELADSKRRFVA